MAPTRSLLLAALVALAACSPAPESGLPGSQAGKSLLLISVDTLRADRLGCYGYERGLTPNLDALAAESVVFDDMYANSCKTASSHMSLFTSMYPSAHKVRNQSARLGLQSPTLANNRLALAQVLNRAGYRCSAVACGGNLDPRLGFGKGFGGRFESGLADVSDLVDRMLWRLQETVREGQPGFLFFHTYQVHGPYLPPRRFMERFAGPPRTVIGERVEKYVDLPFNKQWSIMNKGDDPFWGGMEDFGPDEASYLSDLYDAEIAYTDEQLGRLLDGLRTLGVLDDYIVVLVADHGEEFLEHGAFEHDQLYRELLHVPCIMRLPGGELGGTRVSGLAGLIDVMPTLLELLGLDGPPTMEGISQVPALSSGRTPGLPLLAERVMFPDDYKATLRTDACSVIFHAVGSRLEAYDLRADPGEQHDLYGTWPAARAPAGRLHEDLTRVFATREALDAVDAGGTVVLSDPEQVAQLQALGYVGQDDEPLPDAPPGTPLDAWPADGP